VLAVATFGLWLVARPGTLSRWASGLRGPHSARWPDREPGVQHRGSGRARRRAPHQAHLYFVAPSHDPSFPSVTRRRVRDRVRVLLVSRRRHGFLVAAAAIAIARVLLVSIIRRHRRRRAVGRGVGGVVMHWRAPRDRRRAARGGSPTGAWPIWRRSSRGSPAATSAPGVTGAARRHRRRRSSPTPEVASRMTSDAPSLDPHPRIEPHEHDRPRAGLASRSRDRRMETGACDGAAGAGRSRSTARRSLRRARQPLSIRAVRSASVRSRRHAALPVAWL